MYWANCAAMNILNKTPVQISKHNSPNTKKTPHWEKEGKFKMNIKEHSYGFTKHKKAGSTQVLRILQ
jgi:hypothetical protein